MVEQNMNSRPSKMVWGNMTAPYIQKADFFSSVEEQENSVSSAFFQGYKIKNAHLLLINLQNPGLPKLQTNIF